jgi:GNAT superfamily N-acetyltransferase
MHVQIMLAFVRMLDIMEWEGDLRPINDFYRRCGYDDIAHRGEKVIIAKEQGSIIGVVRLCRDRGVLLLRGMEVAEGFRHRGVATRLLTKVQEAVGDGECYGISYAHLEKLYSGGGFDFLSDEGIAPMAVRSRLATYRQERPDCDYRIMVRRKRVPQAGDLSQ